MATKADPGLDTLIDLNGEIVVLESGLWVKFVAHRIPADDRRPFGISYSLTLHDRSGNRLFGIDNAHPARTGRGPSGKRTTVMDHMHRANVVLPYRYRDAATLLSDFWTGVASVLGSGESQ